MSSSQNSDDACTYPTDKRGECLMVVCGADIASLSGVQPRRFDSMTATELPLGLALAVGLGLLGCSGGQGPSGSGGVVGSSGGRGAGGSAGGGAGGTVRTGGAGGTVGTGGTVRTGGAGGTVGTGGAAGRGSGGSGGAAGGGGTAGRVGSGGAGGRVGVGGTGGGVGSGGAIGSGGVTGGDQCAADRACPPIQCLVPPCPDNVCVLGRDGFHQCQQRAHLMPESCDQAGMPCCTADSQCTERANGECLSNSVGYCGGPAPPPGNSCRYSDCRSDADCTASPNGICTAGYPRICIYGPCRRNADCTNASGGTCVLGVTGLICQGPAVYCAYSSDPCRVNSDCTGSSLYGKRCIPNTNLHGTTCQDAPPPPP